MKVPWQAYLGEGHPLLSDQGRVLATVVADGSGHHDALCGTTTLAGNAAKYGAGEVHSASPAGRELFLLSAAKNGLTATLVGERGPEVFVPTSAGRVETGPAAGQGKDVRVAIQVAVPRGQAAPTAMQRSSRQIASAVRRALQQA